jgi:hypothetical protein
MLFAHRTEIPSCIERAPPAEQYAVLKHCGGMSLLDAHSISRHMDGKEHMKLFLQLTLLRHLVFGL